MGVYRGGGDLEGRIGSGPETEQGTEHIWSEYRVDQRQSRY